MESDRYPESEWNERTFMVCCCTLLVIQTFIISYSFGIVFACAMVKRWIKEADDDSQVRSHKHKFQFSNIELEV